MFHETKNIMFFSVGELPCHDGSFYDYYWNGDKKYWIPWIKLVPEYEHEPSVNMYLFVTHVLSYCANYDSSAYPLSSVPRLLTVTINYYTCVHLLQKLLLLCAE